MYRTFKVMSAAFLAVLATAAMANAQNLVPNGDFSVAGGVGWAGVEAGVGVDFSYPDTGGNTGGYAQIDQTAANWGGVFVSQEDGSNGINLASLGITTPGSYTFTIDMIDLNPANGGVTAGMKIENWDGAANIGDSGDVLFALTDTWQTYTFDYDVLAGSTGLKFVPLMVGQSVGSSVGFDNVGVFGGPVAVPEPGSLALISLGVVGLVARRRRK